MYELHIYIKIAIYLYTYVFVIHILILISIYIQRERSSLKKCIGLLQGILGLGVRVQGLGVQGSGLKHQVMQLTSLEEWCQQFLMHLCLRLGAEKERERGLSSSLCKPLVYILQKPNHALVKLLRKSLNCTSEDQGSWVPRLLCSIRQRSKAVSSTSTKDRARFDPEDASRSSSAARTRAILQRKARGPNPKPRNLNPKIRMTP